MNHKAHKEDGLSPYYAPTSKNSKSVSYWDNLYHQAVLQYTMNEVWDLASFDQVLQDARKAASLFVQRMKEDTG